MKSSLQHVDRCSFAAVLRIAFPLVMAASGHAFRLLADRIMLARYSASAISAAMPAGLACFVLMCFFLGTAGYVNAFVAQYTGSGQSHKVGLAVWQAVFLALMGWVVVALCSLFAEPLFALVGHAPDIQVDQVRYYRVLCWFGGAPLVLSALLAFWSGRGHTWVVMVIELVAAAFNILLNYLLIFGHGGFPRLGITGAALATGGSGLFAAGVALYLFLAPRHRKQFGTWPRRLFDASLFRRLLRYGMPNGVKFMLELAAFNTFIIILGRVGPTELEAANMAFGLNAVAFIPIVGLGQAATVLVGQSLGANRPDDAATAVRRTIEIGLIYAGTIGGIMLVAPNLLLRPFQRPGDVAQVDALLMAARCLRYISVYVLVDVFSIIYSHAVRGAGDTRFAMVAGLTISWVAMVLPCSLGLVLGANVWILWRLFVGHVVVGAVVFYLRFRSGQWRTMRVIEMPASEEPAVEELAT